MSTYLVTGGAGFIGSHLVERLLELRHRVFILDNFSTGSLENVQHLIHDDRLEVVRGTTSNLALVNRMVEQVDVIYHLAATVGVMKVMEQPAEVIENNVGGTNAVLKAARRNRTKIVIASTSEVYGKNVAVPFREDDDLLLGPTTKARWSYAYSKVLDEMLGLAYCDQYAVPAVIVRFFNTIGPRQVGRYGMVVPRFLAQAAMGHNLTVFGDGTQSRCFTYVADTVEWLVRLGRMDSAVGSVFNLGNPHEITITGLARKVIEMTGAQVGIDYTPYEQAYKDGFEDTHRRVPDISKVESATGYSPQVGLTEALETTYAWLTQGTAVHKSLLASAGA